MVAVSATEKKGSRRAQRCARFVSCSFRCAGFATGGQFLMTYRTASVAAKAVTSSTAAAVALALAGALHALAQQPSTTPPTPPAQAAPGPDAGETSPSERHQMQLIATPWTKYCAKGLSTKSSEIKAEEVCFTASDAHQPSGGKLAIALLIEPERVDAKLFRVTLPLGVALIPGARIVIDDKEAMTAPYVVCLPKHGCMADYKADDDLIAKLKNGRTLAIQAFDKGRLISFSLPLADFAKAYDGPPSDPTGLNEQGSLPNELRGHSEDHLDTPGGK
jgi:invasion protein IalB